VVGLLPWIVTGMRLPLQNLWSSSTTDPADMPVALLPFSQYSVVLIAGLVLVGGAVGGLVGRRLRPRLGRAGVVAAALGLLGVHLVALVETAVVTGAGLSTDRSVGTSSSLSAAQVYLAALVVGTIGAIAVALVLFLVLVRVPGPGLVVACAVVALAFGVWVNAFVDPGTRIGDEGTAAVLAVTRWVPAVVLGVAIAVVGIRTAGRVVAAVVSLLVLWTGTAAITAVATAFGSRVYLPYPVDLATFGLQVFGAAIGPAGAGLWNALAAAVIGIAGALVLGARRRSPRALR